jgi:F-type H+-transporting ATPase subunit epsilon
MAEGTLDLEIVTPQQLLLRAPVSEFVGPGWNGQFGVLPGHQSMVIALRPGVVRYTTPDRATHRIAVGGGFAVVEADRATILADVAEAADDIDVDRARTAEGRARKSLEGLGQESPDYAEQKAALDRAVARIDAAAARAL